MTEAAPRFCDIVRFPVLQLHFEPLCWINLIKLSAWIFDLLNVLLFVASLLNELLVVEWTEWLFICLVYACAFHDYTSVTAVVPTSSSCALLTDYTVLM